MGLFDDVVKINNQIGTVENNLKAAANDPIVIAVKEGIKLLPEGGLKSWVSKNPAQFWKSIIELFTGKKYTSNEYRIGERYYDNLVSEGSADQVKSWRDVPDEIVPIAQQLMTVLFGVRITHQDDLDNLQKGVDQYFSRWERDDIPRKAVERAVWLKQNKFPDSLYNTQKWDLTQFEKFPLVAPIPSITYRQLYTGELPGGAMARNGVIEGDSMVKQVLDSIQVDTETGDEMVPIPTNRTLGNTAPLLWIGLGIAGLYLLSRGKKTRG